MSVPVYEFRCSDCAMQHIQGPPFVAYYVFQQHRLPLSWHWGWCNTCQCPRRIEVLQEQLELENELAQARENKESLMNGPDGQLQRLLWRAPDNFEVAQLEHNIKLLEEHLSWRQQRTHAPKCLHCGSTDNAPFPHEGKFGDGIEERWTDMQVHHPGCGGQLQVGSRMQVIWEHKQVATYSPEGDQLSFQEVAIKQD